MKKILLIYGIILVMIPHDLLSANAPVSTIGTITSAGTTAVVPITAINFINIGSCNLRILYNPSVVTATSVTIGPSVGGSISTNLTVPGIISIGWYTWPGKNMPDNSVIFNITFSKVVAGTSPLTFSDDGYSCIWYDGNWNPLNDIPTENFYINGSVTFLGSLVADFVASNPAPPKNTAVQFTDLTTGGPTAWTWSFNSPSVAYVNGTNANSQNPQVVFTEGGPYTVTLVAQNSGSTDTEVKVDYIWAGTPGLWEGVTSTAWSTTLNWDNWLVPVISTDVVIPSSAPFWPEYSGDLTIGTTCNSITLNDSSLLTISGNFEINPGKSLNITDQGIMKIGGNWINSGTFIATIGTVEFFGTNDASIISGGSPPVMNNFYNLTVSKTGAILSIIPDIIVNGDLRISP